MNVKFHSPLIGGNRHDNATLQVVGGGGGVLGGLFLSDCFFVASVDLATHCERSFGHLTQGSSLNVSERVVEPDMYDKHSASGVCFCGTK